MATYTETIGLHQWEAQDSFLRSDFNEDFRKIDAGLADACGKAADMGSWLADAIARTEYESLQVRMGAQLAGQTVPQGRGLLFDCLANKGRISLSGGCVLDSGKGGVLLDTGAGLRDFDYNFGTDTYTYISTTNETTTLERYFTANGSGILRSITVYLSGEEGATVYLVNNSGQQMWSGSITLSASDDTARAYTVYPNAAIQGGASYRIKIHRSGSRLRVYGKSEGFGYRCACSSSTGKSGTVDTTAQIMPAFCTARVWARHIGGSVSCSIQRGGGVWEALTVTGMRQTTDLRGRACTETEFGLPMSSEAKGGAVALRFSLQSEENMYLCDYGAALI